MKTFHVTEIAIDQGHRIVSHIIRPPRKRGTYVSRWFWWPTLVKDVEQFCKSCRTCRHLPPPLPGLSHMKVWNQGPLHEKRLASLKSIACKSLILKPIGQKNVVKKINTWYVRLLLQGSGRIG